MICHESLKNLQKKNLSKRLSLLLRRDETVLNQLFTIDFNLVIVLPKIQTKSVRFY